MQRLFILVGGVVVSASMAVAAGRAVDGLEVTASEPAVVAACLKRSALVAQVSWKSRTGRPRGYLRGAGGNLPEQPTFLAVKQAALGWIVVDLDNGPQDQIGGGSRVQMAFERSSLDARWLAGDLYRAARSTAYVPNVYAEGTVAEVWQVARPRKWANVIDRCVRGLATPIRRYNP